MSRSGYSTNIDNWDLIRWRGQVMSIVRGKTGQAFLQELVAALEAMPEKRLITEELQTPDGEVCALGALGVKRGIEMSDLDPEDYENLASAFGIKCQLIQEIEFENDENMAYFTPEERWEYMYEWAKSLLKPAEVDKAP